jgi:hypothetical protein
METPVAVKTTHTFASRGEALGHFFERAGEAPRLIAFEEEVGCPLHTALSVLEWTSAVGILQDHDLVHAARLSGETASAVVERRVEGKNTFVYYGPRMDAAPAAPQEGALLFDEPGVRAYQFAQRAHGLAHFLRATQGVGAVVSFLSRRAPELRHVRRWLVQFFQDPTPGVSNNMLAGWFATTASGILYAPSTKTGAYLYDEIGDANVE